MRHLASLSVSTQTVFSNLSPANLTHRRVQTGYCALTEYLSCDESAFASSQDMLKEEIQKKKKEKKDL